MLVTGKGLFGFAGRTRQFPPENKSPDQRKARALTAEKGRTMRGIADQAAVRECHGEPETVDMLASPADGATGGATSMPGDIALLPANTPFKC